MSDGQWPTPLSWPPHALTDGTIALDRLSDADIPRIVYGCADAQSQRWLPLPSPYGEAEALAFLKGRTAAAERGEELTFAVRAVSSPLLTGVMGLSQRGRRHEAEIGYWTTPDHRGLGLTARAARLVAAYAFATWPLRRIEILVDPSNHPSLGVATAAGAVREGLRRNGLPSTVGTDAVVFSFVPGG